VRKRIGFFFGKFVSLPKSFNLLLHFQPWLQYPQVLLLPLVELHHPFTLTRSGNCQRKKVLQEADLPQQQQQQLVPLLLSWRIVLLLLLLLLPHTEGVLSQESVLGLWRNKEQGSTSWGAAWLCSFAGESIAILKEMSFIEGKREMAL